MKTTIEFKHKRRKVQTSVTISQEARAMLEVMAEENGIPKSVVMEMAIRRLAKELGAGA